jgi:integrase
MRHETSATSAAIHSLLGPSFVTLHSRLERGGALQARKLSNGAVQLYWRYSLGGKTSREPIGVYDPSAPPKKLQPTARGYGIAAELEKCKELAGVHADRSLTGGLRAAKTEKQEKYAALQMAAAESSMRTLQRLLDTYVAFLKAQGRRSHIDAAQLFKRHVIEAWPAVAKAPATELSPDQVMGMLRRLIEAGKGRSANKLRSYLRAAYQCAQDVRTTPSIPVAFKHFSIVFNPVAQTRRSPQFDCADKRPFSKPELCAYWKLIADRPVLEAAVLRLHLLTGGQRIEQFVRLRWADVEGDALTIFDGKGRPGQHPRPHRVPLVKEAQQAIKSLARDGIYAISTTAGDKQISVRTMAAWAHAVVGEAIAEFRLKRIRSGVETLLASCGVSREIRGHLQSHGQTGVQARHYDGHDYMPEKRRALEILVRELQPEVIRQSAPEAEARPPARRLIARARRFALRPPSTQV